MSDTQRNFLILICIAVIGFAFSGAFNIVAGSLMLILNILFVVALTWLMWDAYNKRRSTIELMDKKWRLLLQASAVAFWLVLFTGMIFPGWSNRGAVAALLFFGLLGAAIYGVWFAWQQRSSRW